MPARRTDPVASTSSETAPIGASQPDCEQLPVRDALDHEEEHRRQEDAEQRHAQHAAEDGRAQRPPHFRAGPVGDHQRHHAEDERERRHQDRPQPQLAGFAAWPRDDRRPASRAVLANSTIRIAFLHARPISTTKPICVKMLMSIFAHRHAGDRAEHAHRHDQNHRQRQRPAFVQRRQHQEHEHHRERETPACRCCRTCVPGRRSRSIRTPSLAAVRVRRALPALRSPRPC